MSPSDEWRREALAWLLAAGLGFLVYLVVRPFLMAMIWAAVLTVFFYPGHRWLLTRVGRPRIAALISTVVVAILLLAPMVWLVPAFVRQAVQTVGQLPSQEIMEHLNNAAEWVSDNVPGSGFSLESTGNDIARGMTGQLGRWSAQLAGNLAAFIIDGIVLLLAMFYLFLDGARLVDLCRDIAPFGGGRHDRMAQEAIDMISATITAGLVVAVVQGVLGGITFAALSLPSPVFWGVVIAFLSLIPILGAWMVWLPGGIGLLLTGDVTRGIILLVAGALLISTIDNFLRPMLIAGRSELNGLLVFVSVLGGMQVFGLIGLVLGPLTVAMAAGLIRGYRESLRRDPIKAPVEVDPV